jgi:hypothetical protein
MLTLDSIAAGQAVFPSVGTDRHAGDLPQIVVILRAMTAGRQVRGEPPAAAAGRHPRPRRGLHLHLARRRRPAVLPQGRRHPGAGRGVQAPHRRPARAGRLPAGLDDDVRDLRRVWIEVWPLKDQTRERYRGILRRELLPVFGPMPLAKIHPHTVRTWVAGQVAGPLSASSVRQHIAVLRSCLKAAQIDGHLDTLPLLGVKMPRSHSRQPAVMTLGEAFAMIDAAPADWQCAIATALFTGLRLGELLALTREDVDLPGRRLNIRATLTEVNGRTPRLRREEPKSRAGYRQVPIVEALAVRLQATWTPWARR